MIVIPMLYQPKQIVMMGQEAITGLSLSVIFSFARYRFPTVPHRVAEAGMFAGIVLLCIGTIMTRVQLTPISIAFFIIGCLCFGAAIHYATAITQPSLTNSSIEAAPAEKNAKMGDIQNNTGIVSQGQAGNNAIISK